MSFTREQLSACCVSQNWLDRVVKEAPNLEGEDFLKKQEEIWWELEESDWLEAFEGHPRIGDVSTLAEKYGHTKGDASFEQSGCDAATMEVLEELKKYNDDYFERYGFIFIVCATGKSAEEMLNILKDRMNNSKNDEIRIAAGEQAKITRIRLEKLL